MRIAPWKDYANRDIPEGALIIHPSEQRGLVVYHAERELPEDQWTVDYGNFESRLCLQIGKKGAAVVNDKPAASGEE